MSRTTILGCTLLALAVAALPSCATRREQQAGTATDETVAAAERNPEVLSDDAMKARGITPPALTRPMPPIYPRRAKEIGLEGEVVMAVKIVESGRAVGARILRSTSPLFDEAAVACVTKWRFEPATKDGKPVAVWYEATVRFTIR